MKKDRNFFLSFILYFNVFCKFENHSVLQYLLSIIVYIAIIACIPQIHQIAFATDMCQISGWERGLAGSSCGKEKEDYNSLDYFDMGIIEECVSLSFDGEDPARSKKAVCRNDAEIEKQSE